MNFQKLCEFLDLSEKTSQLLQELEQCQNYLPAGLILSSQESLTL